MYYCCCVSHQYNERENTSVGGQFTKISTDSTVHHLAGCNRCFTVCNAVLETLTILLLNRMMSKLKGIRGSGQSRDKHCKPSATSLDRTMSRQKGIRGSGQLIKEEALQTFSSKLNSELVKDEGTAASWSKFSCRKERIWRPFHSI